MIRMAETDERIIDKFLNRKTMPKRDKKNVRGSISSYKYSIKPVNGKDIESIEYELAQKKLFKSISKEEKLQLYYEKKREMKINKYDRKPRKTELSMYVLPERTSILEL